MGCWTRPRQTRSPREAGEKVPARLFPKQEGRLGEEDVRRGRAGAAESGAEDTPSAAQCAPHPPRRPWKGKARPEEGLPPAQQEKAAG